MALTIQRGSGATFVASGSALIAAVQYNGTTQNHGMFDGGVTDPAHTYRLNYDGNFYTHALYDTTMGGSVKAYDDARWTDIQRLGFVDNTQTTLNFNSSIYLFTLVDNGAGWDYIWNGVVYHISGNKIVYLPGSPPTQGFYFISIGDGIGTLSVGSDEVLTDGTVPVAGIFWDNSATPKYWLSDERHTCLIDSRTHYYEHSTFGTRYLTGGFPSGYVVNPGAGAVTDADNCFAISACTILDEDLIINISALPQPTGSGTDYTVFYRTNPTSWAWVNNGVPFPYSGTFIQWDNGGTLTTGSNTNFYNSYLVYSNLSGQAGFFILTGEGQFSSLANAQAESPTTFDLTHLPIEEFLIAYQFTWHAANASSSKGKVRLAATPVKINLNFTVSTSAAIPSHNALNGLQGGLASNEYYHLTTDDWAGILGDNYISNGHFENNTTTGWSLYNDGATSSPVDGTGGVVTNLTFNPINTDPLFGTSGSIDGQLSKAAFNCEGEGVSYDFPFDFVALTQDIKVKFAYKTSANYVSGDVGLYVYDINSTTLITPIISSLPANTTGTVFYTTFTPDSTSTANNTYRLIFHIKTVNASAWTLDLDGITVSLLGIASSSGIGLAKPDGTSVTIDNAGALSATFVAAGSATIGALQYNGTSQLTATFDGSTTAPSHTTRLNYDGYFYATKFFGDGTGLTGVTNINVDIFQKNYITNYGFETDLTGWNTYNDGATATPVDGTGGSSTLNAVRVVSGALSGLAYLKLSQVAATNTQGSGISYDFTTDTGDNSPGIVTVTFLYSNQGIYNDGDISVFVYNKDTSALIGTIIGSTTSGVPIPFVPTFTSINYVKFGFIKPSASVNFRLIFHCTVATTSGFDVAIDNVVVKYEPGLVSVGTQIGSLLYAGSLQRAGAFDGGASTPSHTTRLNYDGYFYATKFLGDGSGLAGIGATAYPATVVANGAFAYNANVAADGYLYSGTTDPSTHTRLNYDGDFYATKFYGDGSSLTGVVTETNIPIIQSYITEFSFEDNLTTGYNTYNDGAVAIPIDGTGGVVTNIVLTSSSSTPLLGTYSGLITKSGTANCQGEGVSYDFTVDNALAYVPQSISFYYQTATYTSGDLGVYIYDVTNGIVITPNIVSIPSSTTPTLFQATWIPNTTSVSYRLIFHIASINTANWTFEFDQVFVGKTPYLTGTAISGWTTYTPIFSAGFGTVSTQSFSWRRVGNNCEVTGTWTCGTIAASTPTISLPFSIVDSSIVTTLRGIGYVNENSNSKQVAPTAVLVNPSDAVVSFGNSGGATGNLVIITNATSIFATGMLCSINFSVALTLWTTNINLVTDFTEYVYNSQTTRDTNDTTSFGSGNQGTPILANTTATYYDCQFTRPIQATDLVLLEFRSKASGLWVPVSNCGYPLSGIFSQTVGLSASQSQTNTNPGGVAMLITSSTKCRVIFLDQAGNVTSVTNIHWTTIIGDATYGFDRWRVRKTSQGNFAEAIGDSTSISTSANISIPVSNYNRTLINVTTAASAITITLPLLSGSHKRYRAVKVDNGAGTVIVAAAGSDKVGLTTNSVSFVLLNIGDRVELEDNGTYWDVINTNGPVTRNVQTTDGSQSSPVAGTWYNLGGSLSLGPGIYDLSWSATTFAVAGSGQGVWAGATLSTGSTTETDVDFTAVNKSQGVSSVNNSISLFKTKRVIVNSSTTFYLNLRNPPTGNMTSIKFLASAGGTADSGNIIIEARRVG